MDYTYASKAKAMHDSLAQLIKENFTVMPDWADLGWYKEYADEIKCMERYKDEGLEDSFNDFTERITALEDELKGIISKREA